MTVQDSLDVIRHSPQEHCVEDAHLILAHADAEGSGTGSLSMCSSTLWCHPKTKYLAHGLRHAVLGGVKGGLLGGYFTYAVSPYYFPLMDDSQAHITIITCTVLGLVVEMLFHLSPSFNIFHLSCWNALIKGLKGFLVKWALWASIVYSIDPSMHAQNLNYTFNKKGVGISMSLMPVLIFLSYFTARFEYDKYRGPASKNKDKTSMDCCGLGAYIPSWCMPLEFAFPAAIGLLSCVEIVEISMAIIDFSQYYEARERYDFVIAKVLTFFIGMVLGYFLEQLYSKKPTEYYRSKKGLVLFNEGSVIFSFALLTLAMVDGAKEAHYQMYMLLSALIAGFFLYDELYYKCFEKSHQAYLEECHERQHADSVLMHDLTERLLEEGDLNDGGEPGFHLNQSINDTTSSRMA